MHCNWYVDVTVWMTVVVTVGPIDNVLSEAIVFVAGAVFFS